MLNSLYHATSAYGASEMLRTRSVRLTMATSKTESNLRGKSKLFFFSTSRIPANEYRKIVGSVGVTIEFNKDFFDERYSSAPVDYWDGWWKKTGSGQMSEKEERIYHDRPIISLSPLNRSINAVHIYSDLKDLKTQSRYIRSLLVATKQAKLPLYFYMDKQAFFRLEERRTVPIRQLIASLETTQPNYSRSIGRDWTQPWRELFWKNTKASLSKEASRVAYNLVYRDHSGDTLRSLEADLHNQKNNAIEMRKMSMIWKKLKIETVKEYHAFLKEKWTKIYDA